MGPNLIEIQNTFLPSAFVQCVRTVCFTLVVQMYGARDRCSGENFSSGNDWLHGSARSERKVMQPPRFELGSNAWKAFVITTKLRKLRHSAWEITLEGTVCTMAGTRTNIYALWKKTIGAQKHHRLPTYVPGARVSRDNVADYFMWRSCFSCLRKLTNSKVVYWLYERSKEPS